MRQHGLRWWLALFAIAGCATSVPTASQGAPFFVVDSATASCAIETVGVELAIQHALARPGYLDCITVTLETHQDGTIWLCNPIRDSAAPGCEGRRMQVHGLDPDRVAATWHAGPDARWSDPIQLLGRVRFR